MKLVVITVCFNDITGLKRTLESLIPYDKNIISHLIIDGGSTDGTKEFLTKVSHESKITYLSESDDGIFHAMNKGMALLKKTVRNVENYYVWFLNSGDIANYINLDLIGNEYDILFFCSRQTSLYYKNLNSLRPYFKHDDANFSEWIKYNSPVHQAVLFSSRLNDKVYYNTDFRNQADTRLIYELIAKHNFKFYNRILCVFELGGNSGDYIDYEKVITQLWEDLYIRNLLTKRSFRFYYIQVLVFQIKYILNRVLGKKLFHIFHAYTLKLKYYVQRQLY